MYFIDTNTCIYFLNGKYPSILEHFRSTSPNQILIPSIVRAELLFGAEKSQKRAENKRKLKRFLNVFNTADFDSKAAIQYSKIRSELEFKGTPIGPNDLLIASIVIANNGILLTNNTKEFSGIPNLHLEDWTKCNS
ncbi:MAG: type II toxin-antitoxin system VapC family toxin [Candidatus Neomarinimicrobiota bacterium]|nr:MAG: type II toxin-antitoxin system VapC family toxin [Candidatus Neomarinimicrobiota bacterium]